MLEFISANWLTLLIILGFLGYIAYLIIARKWDSLREFAYALMLSAERLFEDNQGKEKFNAVFDELYNSIPGWMQFFIKPEEIKARLQAWYDIAKDLLDDAAINNSINK